MGLLSSLFGGGGYEPDDALYDRILAGPNRVIQERQDATMEDPSIARLVSEEGRAEIFQETASRLDTAYRNAMMLGEGNLSRAGLEGSSASTLLRSRLDRDRLETLNTATTESNLAHGQFVAGLLSDFRKEHMAHTAMKVGAFNAREGRRMQQSASEQGMVSGLLQGAGYAIGGGALEGFDITRPFGFDWVGM